MSFRKRLIGGVVALALVVTMVNLGLWQLRRHDEKRRLNDRVESRMDLEPVGISALYEQAVLSGLSGLLGEGGLLGGESGVRSSEYRRVTDIGDFVCEQEVLIRNRTLDGRPGYWVFTPFVVLEEGSGSADDLRDQQSYIVNRGWLPLELAPAHTSENAARSPAVSGILDSASNSDTLQPSFPEDVLASLPPPKPNPCNTTNVEMTGMIRVPRTGSAKECESLAPVCTFAQPDTAAIASHLASAAEAASDSSLASVNSDFYIQLESVDPPPEDTLVLLGAPSFGTGNHLSYAVQWFIFSTIAAVGYFLIFWRKGTLRKGRKSAEQEASEASFE